MAKINIPVTFTIDTWSLIEPITDQCNATEIYEFVRSLDIQAGNPDLTKKLLGYLLTSYRDGIGRDLRIEDINELLED